MNKDMCQMKSNFQMAVRDSETFRLPLKVTERMYFKIFCEKTLHLCKEQTNPLFYLIYETVSKRDHEVIPFLEDKGSNQRFSERCFTLYVIS